jgi:hypothetical protein
MMERLTCGLYDPDRERSPYCKTRTGTPEHKSRLLSRSHQGPIMERQPELYRERQWDLYRRSVAEGMPDSDYKTAVLAGIAHKLRMLDRMEAASQSSSIEKATTTDRSGGLARAARSGRNGSS